MDLICLDLEGVLVPEIWIEFSKFTGIEKLNLTTRDIPDYDVLMNKRLSILREHGVTLTAIQEVIVQLDRGWEHSTGLVNLLRPTSLVVLMP